MKTIPFEAFGVQAWADDSPAAVGLCADLMIGNAVINRPNYCVLTGPVAAHTMAVLACELGSALRVTGYTLDFTTPRERQVLALALCADDVKNRRVPGHAWRTLARGVDDSVTACSTMASALATIYRALTHDNLHHPKWSVLFLPHLGPAIEEHGLRGALARYEQFFAPMCFN